MSLRVQKINKRFGERPVVQDVSFEVADSELVALLGPSGSGKSTILRIVAGLTPCDSGIVHVDGEDVTDQPPQQRDLGFVFQNYALFEHMTVADNIEFALRVRGVDRDTRARRRDELLEQVGLGGSGRKYPGQLSGGQRQRTALARALAHRPRLLLLDEPFGALDAQIRQELRQGLRTLLKDLGTTAVFVTHDQEEAFAVADRIMVLHRGRLLEQGPPEDLYHSPRTEFVARFVGRANVLPGEMTAEGVQPRLGRAANPRAVPKRVKVLYRPERLRITAADAQALPREYQLLSRDAEVRHIEYLGASERVDLGIRTEADESMVPDILLSVLRSVDQRSDPRLFVGQRVAVYGRQPHAITRPSLRLLIVAGRQAAELEALQQLLGYAESEHCVVTVLADGLGQSSLAGRIEQWRQSFAGDLKVVDVKELGVSLLDAARSQLAQDRYDLVAFDASRVGEPEWFDLLSLSGVRHVLVAGSAPLPLRANPEARWSLLVRRFSTQHPDLGLFGELLQQAEARVELVDLGGVVRHHEVVERSLAALVLRSTKVTIAGLRHPHADESEEIDPASLDAELVAVDLGPRARLGARQRTWVQRLRGRWLLLIVQPDEVDIELGPHAFPPSSSRAARTEATPTDS